MDKLKDLNLKDLITTPFLFRILMDILPIIEGNIKSKYDILKTYIEDK